MDIIDTLFNTTASIGVIPESDHNNHAINESILFDMVGHNKHALSKVLSDAGKFAVRDNLLEDGVGVINGITTIIDTPTCADCTAILATAKEANDSDYELYVKAIILSKELMKSMKEKYGSKASERVACCTKELENNPKIMAAVDNAKNEFCCK